MKIKKKINQKKNKKERNIKTQNTEHKILFFPTFARCFLFSVTKHGIEFRKSKSKKKKRARNQAHVHRHRNNRNFLEREKEERENLTGASVGWTLDSAATMALAAAKTVSAVALLLLLLRLPMVGFGCAKGSIFGSPEIGNRRWRNGFAAARCNHGFGKRRIKNERKKLRMKRKVCVLRMIEYSTEQRSEVK